MSDIVYNVNDVRVMINQLTEHRPLIKIFIESEVASYWQLKEGADVPNPLWEVDYTQFTDEREVFSFGEDVAYNENNQVYGNMFIQRGVGYYELDTFLAHLDHFVSDVDNGNFVYEHDDNQYSFYSFNYWCWNMVELEMYHPEVVEDTSYITEIETVLGNAEFEGVFGWNVNARTGEMGKYWGIENETE